MVVGIALGLDCTCILGVGLVANFFAYCFYRQAVQVNPTCTYLPQRYPQEPFAQTTAMKLNVAATVLAYAAMSVTSVSAVYSNAAGTCLSAVIANAGQQRDVDWSDEAAYYTIGNTNSNNYNYANNDQDGDDEQEGGDEEQEQDAEAQQAEYNIQTQMKSLAESLGLGYQEEDDGEDEEQDGNNQQAFNAEDLE